MNDSFGDDDNPKTNTPTPVDTHHIFSNKWDMDSGQHKPSVSTTGIEASQVILSALRLKRGAQTAQWLNDLSPGIVSSDNLSNPTDETLLAAIMQGLDKLFDEFELYASQFNLTAQGTDFIVSCTRPIKRDTTQTLYGEASESGLSYAGHLSTRYWAMVLRACTSKVEVFIIPAELLIGFSVHSIDESGYKPLLVVEADRQDNKVTWHIDKTIITLENVPLLAKELFGDLIRIATGQMSESELFAHPLQEPALGQNLAVGYTANNTKSPLPLPSNNSKVVVPEKNAANVSLEAKGKPASLNSLTLAKELLNVLDQDINQLLELGKQALQSNDNASFEQIKIQTAKLEALKISLTNILKVSS